MKIKEMNLEQRPREKAIRYGLSSLSDVELVALLLQSGNKKRDVFLIAEDLVIKSDYFAKLFELTLNDLIQIQGVREVKALQVLGSIELCKRAMKAEAYSTEISSPSDIINWFEITYGYEKQENFVAVFLDTKGKIITHRIIFKGTLNESCVHPRDIFKEAFLQNACSVIVVHNHPSGDPTPSQADISCTRQLVEISTMMGIHFMDHVIVGRNKWFSFREHKYLD